MISYTPADEFALNAEDRMERKWERIPLGFAKNPRNPNVDWRIYYADHTKPNGYYTVSNLECPDPEDAPQDGVVCILQYMTQQDLDLIYNVTWEETGDPDEIIRPAVFGEIYFINENGVWQGGSGAETLQDRDARGIPYSAVKNGYWTDYETFCRIMEYAAFDTDFSEGITFPSTEVAE